MRVTFIDGATVVQVCDSTKGSNTGHTGIHRRKDGTYQVCKGKDILGWCKNLGEAVALRDEADKRKTDGTYSIWLAEIHAARRRKNSRG